MVYLKIILTFNFLIFVGGVLNSQEPSPASPSSSYNNEYHNNKGNEIEQTKPVNIVKQVFI